MSDITPERAGEVLNACRVAPKGKVPQFFRCGCCECFHAVDFWGDCRMDSERFAMEMTSPGLWGIESDSGEENQMAKQVSAQYVEGIKEGRKLFDWWKRDGFFTRELLTENIESLERLRVKIAPLAYSAIEIEFFDGQIDFYRNQLKRLDNPA